MMINAAGVLNRFAMLLRPPGDLTTFSFSMLGDALRDALDPRLRNR